MYFERSLGQTYSRVCASTPRLSCLLVPGRSGRLTSRRAPSAKENSLPKRVQLQRRKDWRKPVGAVLVARPTRWGNPFDWRESGPRCRCRAVSALAAIQRLRPDRATRSRHVLLVRAGPAVPCRSPATRGEPMMDVERHRPLRSFGLLDIERRYTCSQLRAVSSTNEHAGGGVQISANYHPDQPAAGHFFRQQDFALHM